MDELIASAGLPALKKALRHARWARDLSGAVALGGGTFVLTMLLGVIALRPQTIIALYALLVGIAMVGGLRMNLMKKALGVAATRQQVVDDVFSYLVPICGGVAIGVITNTGNNLVATKPYSVGWWLWIGVAAYAALRVGGARHILDDLIRRLVYAVDMLEVGASAPWSDHVSVDGEGSREPQPRQVTHEGGGPS